MAMMRMLMAMMMIMMGWFWLMMIIITDDSEGDDEDDGFHNNYDDDDNDFLVTDTHIVKQIKAICREHAEEGPKDSSSNLEKIFLTKSPMQALYNLEVRVIIKSTTLSLRTLI
jgi:hypothetical protein